MESFWNGFEKTAEEKRSPSSSYVLPAIGFAGGTGAFLYGRKAVPKAVREYTNIRNLIHETHKHKTKEELAAMGKLSDKALSKVFLSYVPLVAGTATATASGLGGLALATKEVKKDQK